MKQTNKQTPPPPPHHHHRHRRRRRRRRRRYDNTHLQCLTTRHERHLKAELLHVATLHDDLQQLRLKVHLVLYRQRRPCQGKYSRSALYQPPPADFPLEYNYSLIYL